MLPDRNGWLRFPGLLWFAGFALLACTERERPTFPTGAGVGVGPEVTITDPAADTSLAEGSIVLIGGTVFDEEGIDSVYFNTIGTPVDLPPYGAGGVARVRFSFPMQLLGEVGDTAILIIYAANLNHVRGDPVRRSIRIK